MKQHETTLNEMEVKRNEMTGKEMKQNEMK
jgi:hypothetical protein